MKQPAIDYYFVPYDLKLAYDCTFASNSFNPNTAVDDFIYGICEGTDVSTFNALYG